MVNLLEILDRDDRACLGSDPEMFVSDSHAEEERAKAFCVRCSVKARCLDYAIERPSLVGVWGGTTHWDRRRMWKASA